MKIVQDLFDLKTKPGAGDIAAIQAMCQIISGRSARCIAVALHALWRVRQKNLTKTAKHHRRPATVRSSWHHIFLARLLITLPGCM